MGLKESNQTNKLWTHRPKSATFVSVFACQLSAMHALVKSYVNNESMYKVHLFLKKKRSKIESYFGSDQHATACLCILRIRLKTENNCM